MRRITLGISSHSSGENLAASFRSSLLFSIFIDSKKVAIFFPFIVCEHSVPVPPVGLPRR